MIVMMMPQTPSYYNVRRELTEAELRVRHLQQELDQVREPVAPAAQ
jgi:hypothetical protein